MGYWQVSLDRRRATGWSRVNKELLAGAAIQRCVHMPKNVEDPESAAMSNIICRHIQFITDISRFSYA